MTTNPTNNVNVPQNDTAFDKVTNSLLKLFNGGVEVYKNVTNKTGVPTPQPVAQSPGVVSANTPIIAGLNQNQLLLIAGGLTIVLLISMAKRR